MRKKKNFAFIDSQNVNLGVQTAGWKLDWRQLRIYLKDKLKVERAYLFIGYMDQNQKLYQYLQECGYILIFKPVLEIKGKAKGNVDAELVLHTMIQLADFDKAVIATGDGDFACLIEHLYVIGKLEKLMVPNKQRYSKFLKQVLGGEDQIIFLNNLQKRLELHEKVPRGTRHT
jgi:uncharacterized LabA/DUF88 family protein